MKTKLQLLLLVFLLAQCQREKSVPEGHYVSVDKFSNKRYVTLDVVDTLITVNNTLVFEAQRDTLVIDDESRLMRSSSRGSNSFYEFRESADTLFLRFAHDGGSDEMAFVQSPASVDDYFANSVLQIRLKSLTGETTVSAQGVSLKHLTIGPMKEGMGWPAQQDSTYVEYENQTLLSFVDLELLGRTLARDSIKSTLVIHYDKETPESRVDDIKSRLARNINRERIWETRLRDEELVFVKSR